jgi:hypothetical protein
VCRLARGLVLAGLTLLSAGALARAEVPVPYPADAWRPPAPKTAPPQPAAKTSSPYQAPPPAGGHVTITPVPVGTSLPPTADVRQAAAQQPGAGMDAAATRDLNQYNIQLEPPGSRRLFRLESEESLQRRMRQEGRQRYPEEQVVFPDEPILSKTAYAGRVWPPQYRFAEPNYVCYNRLYFEQPNFERYGWDLGAITPFVSAGKFFADMALLPYKAGTDPCRKYECSAGYCLPGDPVPLLVYPPEQSLTGYVSEAGAAIALLAIFP